MFSPFFLGWFRTRLAPFSVMVACVCFSSFAFSAPAGKWYRYYDSRGVSTTSSNITQAHIRHGYEVLNEHMYVIHRVPAGTPTSEAEFQRKMAEKEKRRAEIERLQRAYGSSSRAIAKRDEVLKGLNAQLDFQNAQYRKLQQSYQALKAEADGYRVKGSAVPAHLTERLNSSYRSMQNMANVIQSTQQNKAKVEQEFNDAIARLKQQEGR